MATLKVIFWNVWCLPRYLTDHQYSSDERARLIVPYLAGYDVILLCEAWTSAAKQVFLQDTHESYPYQYTDYDAGPISFGTGLMVLSKHPILKTSKIIYQLSANWDWFSNKGAFHFQISPNGKTYDFFLTHMQATYQDTGLSFMNYSIESQTARQYQCLELSNFIRKKLENNVSANIFAIGDYNIRPYFDTKSNNKNVENDMILRAGCYEMLKHQIGMDDLQTRPGDVYRFFTRRTDTKNITITYMDQHGLSDGEYVLIEIPLV